MNMQDISRRELLKSSAAALAGLTMPQADWFLRAAPLQAGEVVLPWLDQLAENPVPQIIGNQPIGEELDTWITPTEQFFSITHYNQPEIDDADWQLEITGLVKQPLTFTLDAIKALPRQELTYTLGCAGNTGLPFFWGGIGNASWAGTPLAPLLEEAGVLEKGIEVVLDLIQADVQEITHWGICPKFLARPRHWLRGFAKPSCV